MSRYHINAAGNPGVCQAKYRCRFGDLESEHYGTREEAQHAYEEKQEAEIAKARKALETLTKLETLNSNLTKKSESLRLEGEALDKLVRNASQLGDVETFEKKYKELNKVEEKRKEVESKRKEVASIISESKKIQETSSQKSTVAQIRLAKEKTIETRARFTKEKSLLQKVEKDFNNKVSSRAPISEIKPILEKLKTQQEKVEQLKAEDRKAMAALSRLEKAEPKRKKSEPVKTLKENKQPVDWRPHSIEGYGYGCGGGRC